MTEYCTVHTGIPLSLHRQCWRCHCLLGPGHGKRISQIGCCEDCLPIVLGQVERTCNERWVTPAEFAAKTGRSPKSVRKLIADGNVKARNVGTEKHGRRYLVLMRDDKPPDAA